MNRKRKTYGKIESQIKRIADRAKNKPQLLLRAFNYLGDPPGEDSAPIEIKFLTVAREPLIYALGEARYKPAAEAIFAYAQKTRLTSEITASIEALRKLNYYQAREFVQGIFDQSSRWYLSFRNHGRARGIPEAERSIFESQRFLNEV